MPRVKVQNDEKPVPKEILAEAVVRIGEAFSKLSQSGLNERAILVLVSDLSGQSKTTVKTVLDALKQLRGYYCR